VKKWAQKNRNNSKLMQLENLGESYGKYNNQKYNMLNGFKKAWVR